MACITQLICSSLVCVNYFFHESETMLFLDEVIPLSQFQTLLVVYVHSVQSALLAPVVCLSGVRD